MAQINQKNKTRTPCIAIISDRPGYAEVKTQIDDLQAFAKNHNLKIERFIEASKYDSTPVESVLSKFDEINEPLVLAWRLDGIPNSIKSLDDVLHLLDHLVSRNISFVSVGDSLDTDSYAHYFISQLRKAWLQLKKNRKITNAYASIIKSKKRGTHLSPKKGRKKQRNDQEIHALRFSGLSIREIASKTGFSTTAVQRSLKTFDKAPKNISRKQDEGLDL